MVEETKQVRVDNWGTFFLQRLQLFFSKTDYCDLTLQFEGNVQLKVHRLVMNACTEYFTLLEQTCPAHEEDTIIMPPDLQSEVIVPIVNFMYTGMLEFHMSIFEKLYKASELMNISILSKLLDAQRVHLQQSRSVRSKSEHKSRANLKKANHKSAFSPDLPSTMPGRKVPVWKRKNAPSISPTPSSTSHSFSDEQLPIPDNRPKPTRFEWPEDDLPPIDTSFEDISLTSKPLLTKEEEEKAKHCFDDLRYNIEIPKRSSGRASSSNSNINTKEVEDYVKEQKIRSSMFEDVDDVDVGQKRKTDQMSSSKIPTKKMKISNKENKETTISVESRDAGNIDHTKIVTEILKKYPDLVKKNKNIKLKIMATSANKTAEKKIVPKTEVTKNQQLDIPVRSQPKPSTKKKKPTPVINNEDGPWACNRCTDLAGEAREFVLYYLYRKHMTDVHNEDFDASLCKYCGRKCSNHNLMMYHLYTKHALKPPPNYNFPKCDKCPFIALSSAILNQHNEQHDPDEIQCQDCKLAFRNSHALTAHIRVTGHYNKPGRVSYDCQYCMKKLQSAINLFTHIKNSHMKEGTRDGIVCLDELDTIDDLDNEEDEEDSSDEYILPEIVADAAIQKEKVKIISNVKVPPTNRQSADSISQSQMTPLEASSEAESLNNVASGIATSLGLVDIVVLDENQQYILQDSQHEQTEFIIPELSSGQSFTGQVITTQHNTVIPQGMIQSSGSDITSTDELVMVLTDHDYPDEHEGENQENSNIVVLYSHPVEGQEGQFITSQGNLLVNSQTGMLEIRNGTTMASSSNQMIMTSAVETPVESIEMIQREIDGHKQLKQEPCEEEERKHEVGTHSSEETVEQSQDNVVKESEEVAVEHERNDSGLPEENTEDQVQEAQSEEVEPEQQQEQCQDVETVGEDQVDSSKDSNVEEPMEIEEIQESTTVKESDNQDQVIEERIEEENPTENVVAPDPEPQTEHSAEYEANEEASTDIPPEKHDVSAEETETVIINDPTFISEIESVETEEHKDKTQEEEEPMEVDGRIEETEEQQQEVENNDGEQDTHNEEIVEEDHREEEKEPTPSVDVTEEVQEEQEVEEEEETVAAENQPESEEVVSTNKDDTADSQQQIEIQEELKKKQVDINKTILDDWEDESDSQQSEKHPDTQESQDAKETEEDSTTKTAAAVEKVNKLMDDWEEEEEEDKKDSD